MARAKVICDKKEIIDVAFRIIEQDGSTALSTRRLAKDMGVSFMTFYNYVSNIDEIKKEVASYGMKLLYTNIFDALQREKNKRVSEFTLTEGCKVIALEVYRFALLHAKLYHFIFLNEGLQFRNDLELRPFYDLYLRLFPKNQHKAYSKEQRMALRMLNHTLNGLITDILTGQKDLTEEEFLTYIDYYVTMMLV